MRFREHFPAHLALNPDAFPMDYSHEAEALAACFVKVSFEHGPRLFWAKGMKIENVSYLKRNRLAKRTFTYIS